MRGILEEPEEERLKLFDLRSGIHPKKKHSAIKMQAADSNQKSYFANDPGYNK
jgi:hypothetical protein